MKRCLILVTSFMLLLGASAFAQSAELWLQFDGTAAFDADDDTVFVGESNIMGLYIAQDLPLQAISLPLEFTNPAGGTWSWDGSYGDAGGQAPPNPALEHGPVVGAWSVSINDFSSLPNQLAMSGAAFAPPFIPASATPILFYSYKLDYGNDNNEDACGFTGHLSQWGLANIELSLSTGPGTTVSVVPDFNGQPGGASDGSDTNPQCWETLIRPCVPPVITSDPGANVNRNHCMDYSFDFDATEGGNNPSADPVTWSTDVGTINASTGELSVTALADCGTTDVTVTAQNACFSTADHSFTINWTNNDPAVTNCPANVAKVGMGNAYNLDLNASDPDPCDALTWSVAQTGGPAAVGTFSIDGTGNFVFDTDDPGDGGNTYEFTATVEDPCGGTGDCVFSVEVLETQPFVIKIEKTHNTIQGQYEYVSITKEAGSELIGGYDFLIGYDASALSFISADFGADVGPAGLGWEYFTYRYGAFGNCAGPCPSGKLRLVAIADQNNGPNHPAGFAVPDGGELALLKFYVTNDRNFECMKVHINFCWVDCGDNGISSVTGDTLFISDQVYGYENPNPLLDPVSYNITDPSCYYAMSFGGACEDCDVSDKYEPVRFILFVNGGIDIVCADSIDDRGDINLNGIENEIADAVLYTNYFLYGTSALDPDPQFRAAQVAASDVNADGIPLSVGDLVYLLRIIVGDALPFPKLAPFANTANVTLANGTLSTSASVDLGAVYATFEVEGAYDLVSHTDMEVLSAETDGMLKVLVYAGTSDMTNAINAGANDLFTVNGNVELVDIDVADYNGNSINTEISKSVLPTSFALHQNVPNPFNPTTKIGLDLPTASDWSIAIYNVAGQLVESFNGNGVGTVTVEWDANNVASGIYFYKATVGDWKQTKKMALLK